jgi:hypothetical protein
MIARSLTFSDSELSRDIIAKGRHLVGIRAIRLTLSRWLWQGTGIQADSLSGAQWKRAKARLPKSEAGISLNPAQDAQERAGKGTVYDGRARVGQGAVRFLLLGGIASSCLLFRVASS